MYKDEIFENALKGSREESISGLKDEVKSIENIIEKLLTQLFECSSSISERDFNVCSL